MLRWHGIADRDPSRRCRDRHQVPCFANVGRACVGEIATFQRRQPETQLLAGEFQPLIILDRLESNRPFDLDPIVVPIDDEPIAADLNPRDGDFDFTLGLDDP